LNYRKCSAQQREQAMFQGPVFVCEQSFAGRFVPGPNDFSTAIIAKIKKSA